MKRVWIFMLWFVVLGFESAAKELLTDEDILRKIDSFIKAGYKCHNNPALALSVVKDGKVFLAKGYGLRSTDNIDENNKVTNQTLFGIASLSKAFASALLVRILEDYDNITLKTQVADVLGDENIFYGYLRGHYATLEDLLAHRLGIPSNNNIRFDDTLTRRNLVKRLRYLRPVGSFRTSYYYNNLIYGLVTYITEKLGKQKWEELVRSKLFEPLGMTSSTFTTTADMNDLERNYLATGYQDNGGELYPVPVEFSRFWGELCGSGCVISNVVDMAKWMMFHLEGGINKQNQRVLKKESLEQCHTAKNVMPPSVARQYYTRPLTPVTLSQYAYGLAWRLGHYRGFPILSHSGSTFGYRAYVRLIPGINAGIFTAMTGTDRKYFFRYNIANYISDLLMGETPWLNETTVCSFPEPWQTEPKSRPTSVRTDIPAQRNLTEYEGEYSNPAYGRMRIEVNQTTGSLNARYGIVLAELHPKNDVDEFYAVSTGYLYHVKNFTTFRFETGKKSVIKKLVIPGFDSNRPPVFSRDTSIIKTRPTSTASSMKSKPTGSSPSVKPVSGFFVMTLTCCILFLCVQ